MPGNKTRIQHVHSLLMKKSGQALTFLAGEMLGLEVGERIPTFSQFAERSAFSRGTLQNGMGNLEAIGAISLSKRGHKGTFLIKKNTTLLLECIGVKYITGTMPLPYTKVYEGLATGLFNTIQTNSGLSVDLAYMRGSEKRIKAVLDRRYDFAVTSRLAANAAMEKGLPVDIIKDFGPRSYLTGQSIVFREPGRTVIESGMRVGVDKASLDHVRLAALAVADREVEIVDVTYNQIMKLLADNRIDAAVWNIDNILEGYPSVNYVPFAVGCELGEDVAVMLVARGNHAVAAVLNEFVDIARILEQQRLVVEGAIYPNY